MEVDDGILLLQAKECQGSVENTRKQVSSGNTLPWSLGWSMVGSNISSFAFELSKLGGNRSCCFQLPSLCNPFLESWEACVNGSLPPSQVIPACVYQFAVPRCHMLGCSESPPSISSFNLENSGRITHSRMVSHWLVTGSLHFFFNSQPSRMRLTDYLECDACFVPEGRRSGKWQNFPLLYRR